MWARIWCEIVQNVGNLSAILLYHILPILYPHIHHVVLYRANTDLTPSKHRYCKNSCSLYKISHSWTFCIWVSAEYLAISSDTIYSYGIGHILTATIGNSYWYCLCFSTLDSSWLKGSFFGSFIFIMVVNPNIGHVCHLLKEI